MYASGSSVGGLACARDGEAEAYVTSPACAGPGESPAALLHQIRDYLAVLSLLSLKIAIEEN